MAIYKNMKLKVKEEKWFRNGEKYNVMMRARPDTLTRKRSVNYVEMGGRILNTL